MLNAEVLDLAGRRIGVETSGQNDALQAELEAIKANFAARGMLRSGAYIIAVAERCSKAAEARCELWWAALHRTVATAGASYSEELTSTLKQYIADRLGFGDLRGYASQAVKLVNMQNASMEREILDVVEKGCSRGIARVNGEIDLFALQLKNQARASHTGDTFNVYGAVGAIQTGTGSWATVTQSLSDENKKGLDDALAQLQRLLESVESLGEGPPKHEIVEVIRDARLEVTKEKPNASKLRGLLATIGTGIRTVAAVKPAYEALKNVVERMGFTF